MKDQNKTKKQLIDELMELRQRITELEALGGEHQLLEERLDRRAKELAALQTTVLEITAPHDLPILLQTIVERAALLLDAKGGGLYLCDTNQREVRCVVSYNTPQDYRGTVLKYGEGAAGTVAQTGEPLIIDDYRAWSKRAAVYEKDQPFTAVLSTPMIWQGQVIGVIHVLHDLESRRFTQGDLELLTLFANHAAIAVENVRLYQEALKEINDRNQAEERLLRQSTILDAINRVLRETLTCDTDEGVACTCLAVAEELTNSKFGFIGEVNQDGKFDTIALSDPGWETCKVLKSDAVVMIRNMDIRGIWGKVIKGKQSLIVNDPDSFPDRVGVPEGHPPITSFLGVPLKQTSRIFGMIALGNKESGYTLENQQDIETLSSAFVEALGRKRAEGALRTEKQRFETLSENAPFGMVMIEQHGTFKYINPKFTELFGYDLNDVPNGKAWFRKAFPDPSYRQKVISTWIDDLESIESGKGILRTFTVTCKDGTEKIIKFISVQLRTGENLVTCEDITERKLAEEALTRSEGEAKRLAQENVIMAEMGRIISSSLKIEEVYEPFAEEAHKLIPFDSIAINMINHKENTITVPYVSGIIVPGCQPGDILPLVGSVTGEVMRTCSGLIIQTEDRNELQTRFPTLLTAFDTGFRSVMAIPLISKDQAIGAIHFRSTNSNVYSDQDIKLAERIGNQISGAIANAELFLELKRVEKALRESEERFRELYDSAPVGYHEYDLEGRITNVNRTDLEMLGYTCEEMVGEFMWKFNVEEEIAHQQILAKLSGTLPPGRNLERTYRRKDGTTFPVLIEDRLIRDEKGQIEGIRSTIQDITERKQAEEALRKNEKRYRSLFENMLDGFAYCRMLFEDNRPQDFVYLDVNCAFEKLTGLRNVVGRKVTEVIPGIRESHPELFEIYGRVALTGQPERFEIYFKPLSAWLSISVYSTEKEYFVAVFDNITERKQAEEELRKSEERYRTILDNIEDGYYEVDLAGNFTFFNNSLCKILGYSRAEMMGMNNRYYMDKETSKKVYQIFNRVYTTGEPNIAFNYKIVRKDGTERFLESPITLIRNAEGERVGFRGIARDITERKRAEEEQEKLIRELQDAINKVKTLSGMLPICASCKKIRDDKGYWHQVESYIRDHTEAEFTHGICPDCMKKLYPDFADEIK